MGFRKTEIKEFPSVETESENKYKFDKETVEGDFERFCQEWDIDTDTEEMEDDEEKKDFRDLKRRLTRVMQLGRLIYNHDRTFTYFYMYPVGTGEEGKSTVIHRTKSGNFLKMDDYAEKKSVHKQNAIISEMIKMPVKFVSKIDSVDFKIITGILNLFLNS